MADISKIKLPGDNTTYNIKDTTARSQSGVTGVKGNSESSYRTGNVNLTAANVATAGSGISISGATITNSGVRSVGTGTTNGTISVNTNGTSANATVKGLENGYVNTHPENGPIIIPFINNDIAHLLKRGGSATITYDGTAQTVDLNSIFDGSGTYYSVNGNISTIVIELTLHKVFNWTNTIYVDFGSTSWRAKSIKIEEMNTNYSGDTWATKLDVTGNSAGHVTANGAHTPTGASNAGGGFNKIRFTFSDFQSISTSGGSFRISQIGVLNYGSLGLREPYMSRGLDDYVFRNITPNANNTYSLGTSSLKWASIYATNFYGALSGNATNVTGVVSLANGGTGKNNALSAFTNLQYRGVATNLNDALSRGIYYHSTACTNQPVSGRYGAVVNVLQVDDTQNNSSNWLWQLHFNTSNNDVYVRCKINGGNFSSWTKLLGSADLSTSTSSTSTTTAATSSAVKTAYDLANTANGTANTALSGVNGTLIYDHTYTISNGVATFTPHVYLKGQEVTTNYAKSCFVWKYKLASDVTGTPSYVTLTTNNDRTCTITISTLGYGGYVLGEFTPA